MNHIESVETAACIALGVDPRASGAQRKAAYRDALKEGHLAPFEAVTGTVQITLPVAAAIDMSRVFAGKTIACKKPMSDAPDFEGFYRRGEQGDLFHPDSIDFEEEREALYCRGRLAHTAATEAGVNSQQAAELLPQSSTVTLILCGTVLDFYRLARVVGPYGVDRHPDVRSLSREILGFFSQQCRELFEVLQEVNP